MRAAVAGVCALLASLLLTVTLQAQEPGLVVRQLDFEGNKSITDEVLASAIATTNSSWFARILPVRWLGLGAKRYFDDRSSGATWSGSRSSTTGAAIQRGGRHARPPHAGGRLHHVQYHRGRADRGRPRSRSPGSTRFPAWLQRIALLDLPLQEGDPFNRYLMQASADSITAGCGTVAIPPPRCSPASRPTSGAKIVARVTLDVDPSAGR